MARGRMISKTLSTSEKRASLHQIVPDLAEFCQQLYPLLVAHSDDFGRLQGDPFTVKHAIDPSSPRGLADFERGLKALDAVGLLTWYELTGGRRYIQIAQFDQHQSGLHKRTTSSFPAPPSGVSGTFQELPTEEKGRELKGTEPNRKNGSAELKRSTPEPPPLVALEIPTSGADGPVYRLSEAQVAEWAVLFPGVDVLAEVRLAAAWLKANPGRRKTARGMPKMLLGWITRSVNNGQARLLKPGKSRPDRDLTEEWGYCFHTPKCTDSDVCRAKRQAERHA